MGLEMRAADTAELMRAADMTPPKLARRLGPLALDGGLDGSLNALNMSLSARAALRSRNNSLTCVAGMLGAPQINLPLAEVDGLPVGLSLLGARGSDEMLIAFAREIEASLKS